MTSQVTPDVTAPTRHGLMRDEWAAIGGAALYLIYFIAITAFNTLHPQLPYLVFLLISVASTVGYLLVLLYSIRQICRLQLSSRMETVLLLLTVILFLVTNPTVQKIAGLLVEGKTLTEVLGSLTTPDTHIVLSIIAPFLLILTGIFFGQIVARLIRERAILVPVAIIAGLIDFWGVYWGPVSIMSAEAPVAVSGLATAATTAATMPESVKQQLPEALRVFANITPPDNIGIGDFVFLAFFFTCAYRLGFSARRTMWGLFAGLLLACVVIAFDGQTVFGREISIQYLPGLVFICSGVLLGNLGSWRLSRQEWVMTLVPVGVLVAIISVFIVRAELSRPQSEDFRFTVTAVAAEDIVARTIKRLSSIENASPNMLPVFAQFDVENNATGMHIAHWQLLALGYGPDRAMRTTYEFVAEGVLMPETQHDWALIVSRSTPPENLLMLVKKDEAPVREQLRALTRMKAIPEEAYAALGQLQAELAKTSTAGGYTIQISADGVLVADLAGQIIKTYPLSTTPTPAQGIQHQ